MEEIVKLITEPIKGFFHRNEYFFLERNTELILLIIVFILFPIFSKFLSWCFKQLKAFILNYTLDYFEGNEIKSVTKYYVETKFQNIDPANQQDLSGNQVFVAREKLIPFFIGKRSITSLPSKYFFVLADSGMGKTTFMINLYFRYIRSIKWHKYHIKLLPLGKRNVDEDIKFIENKNRTILLLDAFDEDSKAILDYKKRLSELINLTVDFKRVIISSRTQFFSSATQEPNETGILKFGGDKGMHDFFKIYISAFTERDIKRYLKKKYLILQFHRKKLAKKIILQCPNLMMRPMLLGYVDDLVNHEKAFVYTFQIYDVLIKKWIDREANRVESAKRNKFKEQLYDFSKAIAIDIYQNRKKRNELSIDGEDIKPFAVNNNINLSDLDLRSRSLLNRNSEGQYKFSHKSILEYFLSLEVYLNNEFKSEFDFESMPQSSKFYSEMCEDNVAANAIYLNKSVPYSDTLFHGIIEKYGNTYDNLYIRKITSIVILNPSVIDEKFFIGLTNVEEVNVLITNINEVEKILLVPNIKHINLLNSYVKRSSWDALQRVQEGEFATKYMSDLKKIILDTVPDINRRIMNKDASLGNRYEPLDLMKGTNDILLQQLRDLYEYVIMDLKKKIRNKKEYIEVTG